MGLFYEACVSKRSCTTRLPMATPADSDSEAPSTQVWFLPPNAEPFALWNTWRLHRPWIWGEVTFLKRPKLNLTDYCSRFQLVFILPCDPLPRLDQFTHVRPNCSILLGFVFITDTTSSPRDPRCVFTSSISTQNFSLPPLRLTLHCVFIQNALIIHVHI